MDYPLEQLDPERFQQFCQALLAQQFPELQCFPVGQPDGGRDAIAFIPGSDADRSFAVYQMKFVRNPQQVKDPHKWLAEILAEELPKVALQIPKGAKQYYLLTNVQGTAHRDVGSIDTIQSALKTHITIPAQCWWRDDINRRLDNAWNLKWAYPELLTGPDIIRAIIEQGLSEHQSRRSSAIRAFLDGQFEQEQEVKFKQIELQNRLLDLFIDVPLTPRRAEDRLVRYALNRTVRATAREPEPPGAATFFLSEVVQDTVPFAVLEGAPGQGKSTLSQYLCQVHRTKIRGDAATLGKIPQEHRSGPLRLPFRVELRDYAMWLSRRDPFSPEEDAPAPAHWERSLEAFLAAQVRYFSGGIEFSVADLHAVSRVSALLLVLDGLDEVADVARRHDVVSEAKKAILRLKGSAASLQVVITSRPAAFANSPGFPARMFPHFELVSLTRDMIELYADRWIAARRLQGQEAAGIRRLLRQKIDQPHLRDLARNPMQLAILLGLIHTRGSALPDQRTELYGSYVELFLNREAAKSETVRERRAQLLELHGYLAWTLHSEAEEGGTRGSASEERLKRLIREHLQHEGRDISLVDELFSQR